jgi:hypothetical protein
MSRLLEDERVLEGRSGCLALERIALIQGRVLGLSGSGCSRVVVWACRRVRIA